MTNIMRQILPPYPFKLYMRLREVIVMKVFHTWSPFHEWLADRLHRYYMSKGHEYWYQKVYNDQQWIIPQSRYYIHNSSMPDTSSEDSDMCTCIVNYPPTA